MGNSSSRPRKPSTPRLDQLELAPGTLLLAIARDDFPKALPKVNESGSFRSRHYCLHCDCDNFTVFHHHFHGYGGTGSTSYGGSSASCLSEKGADTSCGSVDSDDAAMVLLIVGIVIVVVVVAGCIYYYCRRRQTAAEQEEDMFIRGRIIRTGPVANGDERILYPGEEVLARAHCGQPMKVDVLGVGNAGELLFLFHRHDVKAVVVGQQHQHQQREQTHFSAHKEKTYYNYNICNNYNHLGKASETKNHQAKPPPTRATPSAPPSRMSPNYGGKEWVLLR